MEFHLAILSVSIAKHSSNCTTHELISFVTFRREQEAILNDLRTDINLEFEFLFSPTHVEVISGKQEGIYSWIAVNYVLGKFDHKNNGTK